MEEYFDILDEFGNKTFKKKLRKEVHRDGDWHKSVHICIMNYNGEVLLQRRSPNKESNPNKLSISAAGHLSFGDDSISGALREIEEELGILVDKEDLKFIKTFKVYAKDPSIFNNNEFTDLYIIHKNLFLDDLKFQEEEISELKFVSYKEFKAMVKNRDKELVMNDNEFEIIFEMFDSKYDK